MKKLHHFTQEKIIEELAILRQHFFLVRLFDQKKLMTYAKIRLLMKNHAIKSGIESLPVEDARHVLPISIKKNTQNWKREVMTSLR